jgi:glycosyltransferase involved in cell wall biosynthesis
MNGRSLRVCLLTYRGNPRCGGQGVYVRHLSRELTELGHEVDVWSGPPYPELLPGVGLTQIPSLDLWNEKHLFRMPSLGELRDPINRTEYLRTMVGTFPEPLTFSQRVARKFRSNGFSAEFDIVHDNQCLGSALLELQTLIPVVTTIHHPITQDRQIALRSAPNFYRRFNIRRWYSFLDMQLEVARQMTRVMTVSETSARALHEEYGIDPERIRHVGNGIDLDIFKPLPEIPRDPNRLLTTLSADSPLKGLVYLLEALAGLRRTRPNLQLTVIGAPAKKSRTWSHVQRFGLTDAVHFTGKVEEADIPRAYASAAIAVIPSLYEGFSFPAGEAMACGVPVVATTAGALPEVVGRDGKAGVLVPPRSGDALARALGELLDAPERRQAMGIAGRQRVQRLFSWRRAAEHIVDVYREVLEERMAIAC